MNLTFVGLAILASMAVRLTTINLPYPAFQPAQSIDASFLPNPSPLEVTLPRTQLRVCQATCDPDLRGSANKRQT